MSTRRHFLRSLPLLPFVIPAVAAAKSADVSIDPRGYGPVIPQQFGCGRRTLKCSCAGWDCLPVYNITISINVSLVGDFGPERMINLGGLGSLARAV